MMRASQWIVGVWALGCSAGALAASTFITTAAHAIGTAIDEPEINAGSGEFSSSSAASSGGAGGSGDGSVQLGVIKVFASSFSGVGNSIGLGNAHGRYTEEFTISSAGFTGMAGKITVGVTLQGFVDPQGSGIGTVDFSFSVNGAGGGFLGSWTVNSDPSFPGGFPVDNVSATAGGPLFYSAIHDVTANFTVGSAIQVTERLAVTANKIGCGVSEAECNLSGAGSVNIDFGHSSYWNGVSAISLLDPATGEYVPADLSLFSMQSASGLDWSASFAPAVPEPEMAWLMAGGILLVGWRIRARRAGLG